MADSKSIILQRSNICLIISSLALLEILLLNILFKAVLIVPLLELEKNMSEFCGFI